MCRIRWFTGHSAGTEIARVFLAALMLSFCTVDRVAAQVHVNVTPRVLVDSQYTDNFFRSAKDEIPVWYTHAGAGLGLEAVTDRSKLNFSYDIGHYFYQDSEKDFDSNKLDYTGHNLNLAAETKQFSRLVFGLEDTFFLTREPSSADAFSNAVDPEKYWRNRMGPFLLYDISEKGQVRLGYRNEALRYLDPKLPKADSDENRGLLTLTYHLNDTNHLDLATQYWERTYSGLSTQSDYTSLQTELIYRHEFNTYFSGEVGGGYQSREFDEGDIDSIGSPVFHIGAQGKSDRTRLEGTLAYNVNDFAQGNEYFKAIRADLFFQRLFLERFRFYLGGYYQYSDYEFTPRRDDVWDASIGLGYRFFHERLELGVEYGHSDRNSNESGFDYTDNRLLGRLNLAFELNRETER